MSRTGVVPQSFGLGHGGCMTGVLFACSLSWLCNFWLFTFVPGYQGNETFVLYFLFHILSFFFHSFFNTNFLLKFTPLGQEDVWSPDAGVLWVHPQLDEFCSLVRMRLQSRDCPLYLYFGCNHY